MAINSNFIAPQPQVSNPFGNRGQFNGGINTMAVNNIYPTNAGQPSGIRAPWDPYNPYLSPGQVDTGGRGTGIGGYLPGSDGARGSSGPGSVGIPAQGPAYNGNFDPNTGWGVPGRGIPGNPNFTPRFGGGANDMSAYNPTYDPSANLGNMGSLRSGKGGGGAGGYGGGNWWDNPAAQGLSDQTRALAPLYAQASGLPGYLQKVVGNRFNPNDPNANTRGQGLW